MCYLSKVAVPSAYPVLLAVIVLEVQLPACEAKSTGPEAEDPTGIVTVRIPPVAPVRVPADAVTETLMAAAVLLTTGLPLLSVMLTLEWNVAPLPLQLE